MGTFLYNLATDKDKGFLAGLFKIFLLALSFIYGLVVRVLSLAYRLRPRRLNCKVISVGNITWGGTGKTSLVEFIARYLKEQGLKVAVVSRGYKRSSTEYRVQSTEFEAMGDEPYMLQKNLKDIPVIVDPDRMRAVNLATRQYGIDTVILDDGLQQWKIKKDLEIITVDCTNPFGNQRLLPRGILREPLSSLKRADIFVLTKTNLAPETGDLIDFLRSLNQNAVTVESIHYPAGFKRLGKYEELKSNAILEGKTVTLVCGIGDPYSFENLITSLGINIGSSFIFPDHHLYSKKDLENIIQTSQRNNIDTIVTTEKDAPRLAQLSVVSCQLSVFVLRIELKITTNEQAFLNRLL